MSDLEQCKKDIAALKADIEERRSQDTSSALAEASNNSSSKQLSMKARRLLKGHFGKIYALHWGPDSQRLVSASQDGLSFDHDLVAFLRILVFPLLGFLTSCFMLLR
jgi:guanine nucleotide-binding protein G(I)/G(S)/G(T) subunit beta-1